MKTWANRSSQFDFSSVCILWLTNGQVVTCTISVSKVRLFILNVSLVLFSLQNNISGFVQKINKSMLILLNCRVSPIVSFHLYIYIYFFFFNKTSRYKKKVILISN